MHTAPFPLVLSPAPPDAPAALAARLAEERRELANPTSNSVYQRIGFRAVQDSTVLDLDPSGGHRT